MTISKAAWLSLIPPTEEGQEPVAYPTTPGGVNLTALQESLAGDMLYCQHPWSEEDMVWLGAVGAVFSEGRPEGFAQTEQE